MAKIFTSSTYKTETWSAQGATLEYFTEGETKLKKLPLLITNFELTYGRSLSQLYPINSDAAGKMSKINICGAPQGTLRVGSIFSPSEKDLISFLESLSAECKVKGYGMKITPLSNVCSSDGKKATKKSIVFTLDGVELESLAVTIQGGQAAMVNQPLTFSFTTLAVDKA